MMRQQICALAIACSILSWPTPGLLAQQVLIEAEAFDDPGGWVVDQQSMDQMGSPYLLAHGLGVPVKDAVTVVKFPEAGKYRVWVRTRDWVATWNASSTPGRFQVVVDGTPLPAMFGTERAAWHWQDGGTVQIESEKVKLALHDLTGFEGRCDAILFAGDADCVPPNEGEDLAAFRRKTLGFSEQPEDAGQFDLVVVGGGMAGTCTAISASRSGLRVALIQDRPVLGGNNSSDVRVHLNGLINLPPYPRLGDVVKELDSGNQGNARPAAFYNDDKKLKVARAEQNLCLFLDTHACRVEKEGNRITAVIARDVGISKELRFAAPLFADCTGDGTIGCLAAADFRTGRESREQTGESMAPEKADTMTMGASVQWYSVETDERSEFPECPWALPFTEQSCEQATRGDWNWEAGLNNDQIGEIERIRDHSLRAIYGNWAFLKNQSKSKAKYANRKLSWVAYVAGKRESRRLLGDVILCQQDVQEQRRFPDAFVTTTWSIDLHYPDPQNSKHFPGQEFKTICTQPAIQPYPIPYRCFYSRNIENLFMAGRDISVTHVALGTVRVMRTCGMMGELVGMAASLCRRHDTTPRGVYESHLAELKVLATRGVGRSSLVGWAPPTESHEPEQAMVGEAHPTQADRARDGFNEALENGKVANEGFLRCHRFVEGWLNHADPKTGLIPRNLAESRDIWNAWDSAADNYPFMVLTAALTDRPMFQGRMLDMLRTETKLTSRLDSMADTYSFSKGGFADAEPGLGRIIFGTSEYIKDGLVPLTEWLGPSPWSQRMIQMLDDLWKHAPVDTPYGQIVSTNQEVNGDNLQALCRVFGLTQDQKYLDWAIRLGDYYLLGDHHPTRNETRLRLRDHGCEIVAGLCELYMTVHFTKPDKKKAYEKPVHEMLDRILEVGRNEHGLFYNWVNPQTGEHDTGLADTWGYDFNGFYSVYLIDGTEAYRQATRKAMSSLSEHYRSYPWEGAGADGYADSIESALNLLNREAVPGVADWLDSEIQVMWRIQKPDGIIEGWHGDGNFARTTIMYCLWKTQGVTIDPWRQDVVLGADLDGDTLRIAIRAGEPWQGRLVFDVPRHKTIMHMPLDWPRINQFPEWWTAQADRNYTVREAVSQSPDAYTGKQLHEGIPIDLQAGLARHFYVHQVGR
ncbi:MAG: FAD-dependent oxidoreductase [Sedimentisphaerales bacterium]|nr:FAD-dependent oxidoreductase [Sedimentisphaerales bacterium]